ncbi:hypothetical protein [Brevibacillus daliensis]|uniref:hypothetical protein n=1 Tax=Brevibacillus daliensis TaxID=2892995 RepID=UPI001E3BDD36|nr:hypothetical protein [Brevibacillus daliensis]
MTKTIKVIIRDFDKIKENLDDSAELKLYEEANGKVFEAEIEADGYAIVDLTEEDYIELAPSEYELMIVDWKVAGKLGELILETKSDPEDDTALVYRGVDAVGNVLQEPTSLPKGLVDQLAKAWFARPKTPRDPEINE